MATWGDGIPPRHRHDDYAPRDHHHPYSEIDGAPDDGIGDYVDHDELEDRLRDLNREIDDNFAKDRHAHDDYVPEAELVELRDQVAELQRDRDAMMRRMRQLEEALSL